MTIYFHLVKQPNVNMNNELINKYTNDKDQNSLPTRDCYTYKVIMEMTAPAKDDSERRATPLGEQSVQQQKRRVHRKIRVGIVILHLR